MALLTADTVVAYTEDQLKALGVDSPFPSGAQLKATEIEGGNLNYAFCVEAGSGQSIFVKQAPDFIKVFGPEAKLTRERMALEVAAYREWEAVLGKEAAAKFLPRIYVFDSVNMVVIMEFLGSCTLLQQSLFAGTASGEVAAGMGEIMGLMHAKTHCTKVPADEAARLAKEYENSTLRDIQLEHVFTKAFRESDLAAELRDDAAFMGELEKIRAKYRGENKADLALVHGDLHPGSVMADDKTGVVKIIDPEFVIYGPPGLDLGSLLSGYALAFVSLSFADDPQAGQVLAAIERVWDSYKATLESNGVAAGVVSSAGEDALGFLGCEVARTALGFAGVRGLPVADEVLKKEADAQALGIARRCILHREGKGIDLLVNELKSLGSSAKRTFSKQSGWCCTV